MKVTKRMRYFMLNWGILSWRKVSSVTLSNLLDSYRKSFLLYFFFLILPALDPLNCFILRKPLVFSSNLSLYFHAILEDVDVTGEEGNNE